MTGPDALLKRMNLGHVHSLDTARAKINEGLAEAAAKLIDAFNRADDADPDEKRAFVAAAESAVGLLEKPLTLMQLAARAESIFRSATTPAPGETAAG
jgi:hypothetical protein